MKNQVKVSKVQKHKTTQSGEVDVVKGKLIFIYSDEGSAPLSLIDGSKDGPIYLNPWKELKKSDDTILLNPIIISETEIILKNDSYYNIDSKEIKTAAISENHVLNENFKIIAHSESLSKKQLQAIVDGKMKDGDDVLVECDTIINTFGSTKEQMDKNLTFLIKLTNDQIILHKAELDDKIYSRKELRYEISCAVAYMMAHPKTTAAEMKTNQDKLDKWIDEYVK